MGLAVAYYDYIQFKNTGKVSKQRIVLPKE
jgi:hypothetical protein